MSDLYVTKATATGTDITPDMHIHIVEGLLPQNTPAWNEFCDHTAEALENALLECLPGGVYSSLLGKMLVRRASHFKVSLK